MKFDFSKLRGRIVEKYRSQNKFAEALGVNPLTVSRKLNCETPFTTTEISIWCSKLGIPLSEVQAYFFSPESSQMETTKEES